MTERRIDCCWCGEEFIATHGLTRFCCENCAKRASAHRRSCPAGDGCTTHVRLKQGRATTPPLELLLRNLDMSGGPDSCWEWMGWRSEEGYGSARVVVENGRQRTMRAHRAVYSLTLGVDLEPGAPLLHSCDNPPCCNPAHLRPGTHLENMADRKTRGAGYYQRAPKVSDEVVAAIRAEHKWHTHGRGAPALAAKYGLPPSTVRKIIRRSGRWSDGCRSEEIAAEETA